MADNKTADIRKFIIDHFSDEELTSFCFDYFRDVFDYFATGMSKTAKVQRLIERCVLHETLPSLLTALRKERPEQYDAKLGKPIAVTPTQEVGRQRDPRQVFISHALEDAQFAHRLAADLEAKGWRAWIAPDSIRPGEKWADAINRGLEECGVFVVALTPVSVVSSWVVTETNVAIELEHKRQLKFIPAEVESCKTPLLWSAYQFVPFRDDYAAGLVTLLAELEAYLKSAEQAVSPQGQATLLYERIKGSPEGLLEEIGNVVAQIESAPEILTELHVLCVRERSPRAPGMATVVQGYTLLLGGHGQWEAGLRSLQSGLSGLKGIEAQAETLAICRLLNSASMANSVDRIAALHPLLDVTDAIASPAIPGFSNVKGVLAHWVKLADSLESYQKTANTGEKVRYLGYALTSLHQANREIKATLVDPLRLMLEEIMARWLDAVNIGLDELHGRAYLQVSMLTQRVLALDDVVVALALRNEGSVNAENVKVEILPSEQYEIVAGEHFVVGAIPAAQSRSTEFHVRPLAGKNFRAEFRISYDDERRAGRSISFVDQIALVQVTEGYQPIPNPYHAGRPLPTGSPLFFGREDVLAFIGTNVGGPSLDNVLVLIGQRRCGKTSLLKQLPDKLNKRYVPVYIDGQQLGIDPGMANLFYGLSQVIASSLSAAGVEVVAPTREDFEPAPSQVFEQEFLARVESALGERRLLLAFDEFEEIETRVREGNLKHTVFPFLRHLMQHSNKLAFMFVGSHKLEELTHDYWSVFFNMALHKQIRFLDDVAAGRLIREPVAESGLVYDDLAIQRILDITAGHPYFVQLICHSLVNCANANKRSYITVEDVRSAVDETIALGEVNFGWLWQEASMKERLVLATLTELLRDETMVTSSTISSFLAKQRLPQHLLLDPAEVSDILSRLTAQDIVEAIPDHVLQYRFELDIVSFWVRRKRPLSRVIADLAAGDLVREKQASDAKAPT